MENITKPKLVFFQWKNKGLSELVSLHRYQHVKCLSEFFEVVVINQDCDFQQICDEYQPDLTLFESGYRSTKVQKIQIQNTSAYPEIPKLGFHNADSWCDCRAGFLSDMEHWGIETFFSISTTTVEHTPEISENLFVWPNFVDPDVYHDYGESKIVPVLFTGYITQLYPWRQRIQKIVSQFYPSLICPHLGYEGRFASRMIYGEKYARMINASFFVPSCGTVAKEVVRKHFEIPGSKSCLITEKTASIEAAGFVDMQNCIFADDNNILDKLDYLFQNLDELEKITSAGYQLVHSRHTLKQRDQIFQWFNLYRTLKPNQRIIQTNPFEPLTIIEQSSGIQNSHVICNGLNRVLLSQGDEKLWAGKYEDAEALYLRCLYYISWMPEPKLRLALCNLYKGNAETAISWISQPIKFTLEVYKALDPDPVEWAYFIISLLCQGKVDEAINCTNQFPSLSHPELERTRWVINVLENEEFQEILHPSEKSNYRYSVHKLPSRSFHDWIDNICLMLQACKQNSLAEYLQNIILSKSKLVSKPNFVKEKTKTFSKKKLFEFLVFSKKKILQKNHFIQGLSVELRSILKTNVLKPLNRLETKYGYFLPYSFSGMINDELFSFVRKLTREEEIKTALVIGASAGQVGTEAVLKGVWENWNKPTVFCINTTNTHFKKLQNRYTNVSIVRCYEISSVLTVNLHGELEPCIENIKKENKINSFDVILIARAGFSGISEVHEIDEARFIILDELNTFESYKIYQRFIAKPNYLLVDQNPSVRNGYAIFQRLININ
ncbi:hypothetical protein AMR41_14040 [Hapalosiphon sp. MRB220]|nr:hypothetical protein AMR41_14040 [Hapalosiphon sp. MRB220]